MKEAMLLEICSAEKKMKLSHIKPENISLNAQAYHTHTHTHTQME